MAEGITRIFVKGFKSLAKECSIEIRPLTLLAGANSSGKSSIMQPLLMMKQTLEASYDPGALLMDGPNVRFTFADQFLSKINGKITNSFIICIELEKSRTIKEVFIKKPKKAIDIEEASYWDKKEKISLRPDMTRDEIISIIPKAVMKLHGSMGETLEKFGLWKIDRNRCFIRAITTLGDEIEPRATFNWGPPTDQFSNQIQNIIHVPALRGNPERNYKTVPIGGRFPGTFESYVASIINKWQMAKDQRLDKLGDDLEILGLSWKVKSRPLDETSVELLVGRLPHSRKGGAKDLVSIPDVGFGLSQILPVLVALLTAEAGQLVYIEQPEIHLHPHAQMAMAKILADAANRGVRVVAETHSALLLLGVQSLVAESKLSSDNVKLHWFKRRPENGVTEVFSADLDKAGAFGDWPEDFSAVEMDADNRYIHAAEARLESN